MLIGYSVFPRVNKFNITQIDRIFQWKYSWRKIATKQLKKPILRTSLVLFYVTMDPAWIEFQAENAMIRIEPRFSAPKLFLLQCDVGPFKAGIPLEVPLWLALSLCQRHKCRIIQPDWMTVDNLTEVKEAEKQEAIFTQLPDPHLFVKAQLIMDVANSDLTRADEVRTIIKDIWDIRQSKLRWTLNKTFWGGFFVIITYHYYRKVVDSFVQSGALRATLNHVHTIELNSVRPLLTHALDQIHRLEMSAADVNRLSQSQNTSALFNNSIY